MNIRLTLNNIGEFSIALLVTNKKGDILFTNKPMKEIMKVENTMKKIINNYSTISEIKSIQINNKKYLFNYTADPQCHYVSLYNEELIEGMVMNTNLFRDLDQDLKAIFENTYDVIYVTDGKGKTLRASSACEKLWGIKQEDLIGQSTFEMEQKGLFKPSVTRLVLEQGIQVQALQNTRTGRRLLVVGTPIKDENGKVIKVINTSRDITNIDKLQSELERTQSMLKGYAEELKTLRLQQESNQMKIIYRSPSMKKIISLAKKIANVYSTVLIYGESGVGKEMFARYIHGQSNNSIDPFISVNCSSLPENLLEEELFGSKNTSDYGILNNAVTGTLLLDEVSEIPLNLQGKLLSFLTNLRKEKRNDKNHYVRIIATSQQDLLEKVNKGEFRKDLYYFLNVIPVNVPSLRQRKDDILPLTMIFVNYFNNLYSLNKQLNHGIIDQFLEYKWPGNVRELRNQIERLIVTVQEDVITEKHLPRHMQLTNTNEEVINLTKIVPLTTALQETEKKLLEMAMNRYDTTTQIAKALHVNQSTISRKINKYFLEDS